MSSVAWWSLALGAWSSLVMTGKVAWLDLMIAESVARVRGPWLDAAMRAIQWFGTDLFGLLALAGIAAWLWPRRGKAATVRLLVAYLISFVMQVALRLIVAQWRPDTDLSTPTTGLMARFHAAGYPSGHALRSAFIFGWLARAWRAPLGRVVCALMIAAVGFTRLYLNRHWASDVVGSWLLAGLVLAMVRHAESGYHSSR